MIDTEILTLLELAKNFAGKDDVRHYLNDVLIRNVGTTCHIVACDGHQLCKIVVEDYQTKLPERLSVDSITKAAKVNEFSLLVASDINPDVLYPEYDRLINVYTKDEKSFPMINAVFLNNLSSAVIRATRKICKAKNTGIDIISMDHDCGAIFSAKIGEAVATFVIMGMKK
jgi:DNA polymerase III sliding clamp (beta) subunit (PCNA family)